MQVPGEFDGIPEYLFRSISKHCISVIEPDDIGQSSSRISLAMEMGWWLMPETIKKTPVAPCRRILVVEDDRVARLAMTKILESMGNEVVSAGTLAEGFAKLDNVHCLFLDLLLPDGDGIEILRKVRAENLPIRVAVTTGITNSEELAPILALNPDAIFQKPVHLPDIAGWLLTPG